VSTDRGDLPPHHLPPHHHPIGPAGGPGAHTQSLRSDNVHGRICEWCGSLGGIGGPRHVCLQMLADKIERLAVLLIESRKEER
jgi:hypothetical protein